MAEKKKILYIVEAMGGGVFTYIVELANELVNKYDMYIAYPVPAFSFLIFLKTCIPRGLYGFLLV